MCVRAHTHTCARACAHVCARTHGGVMGAAEAARTTCIAPAQRCRRTHTHVHPHTHGLCGATPFVRSVPRSDVSTSTAEWRRQAAAWLWPCAADAGLGQRRCGAHRLRLRSGESSSRRMEASATTRDHQSACGGPSPARYSDGCLWPLGEDACCARQCHRYNDSCCYSAAPPQHV